MNICQNFEAGLTAGSYTLGVTTVVLALVTFRMRPSKVRLRKGAFDETDIDLDIQLL